MTDLDLFHNETPTKTSEFLTVLPVSVIEIAAQKKRDKEDHSTTSSRSNYSPFHNHSYPSQSQALDKHNRHNDHCISDI